MPLKVVRGEDQIARCSWAGSHADYVTYHDKEWGQPVRDDRRLFEKLCLEGFQSGLSWLTILRKRDNFRAAFSDFDFDRIARWNERSVERLLKDAGIVRHRGKIEATLNNARCAKELVKECGSVAAFFWRFEPEPAARPNKITPAVASKLTETEESRALSKELRKRGFKFVGPTTSYALMQAMGMVNDHLEGCHARPKIEQARKAFRRPR